MLILQEFGFKWNALLSTERESIIYSIKKCCQEKNIMIEEWKKDVWEKEKNALLLFEERLMLMNVRDVFLM
jgi:hypothetical protein